VSAIQFASYYKKKEEKMADGIKDLYRKLL